MKRLLLLISILLIVNAEEVVVNKNNFLDINYLKTLDKDLKRDLYLNEYLKTNISKEQAYNTLSLIENMNNEMFFNFAKKFKDDETLAVAQCMNMNTKELIDSYSDCIAIGLSLKEASVLSSVELELVIQKTSSKYPIFAKQLKVISSSIPFTKLIVQKKDQFYDIFFNVSKEFREKYFDYKLPRRTLSKIIIDTGKFNKFLSITLIDKKMKKLNKFLLDTDDTQLSSESSFLLALNAIRFNDLNKSMDFLNNAAKKDTDKYIQDKILFWKYLITKDESYLEKLSSSLDINFYSLYANELLEKKLDDFNFLNRINDIDTLKDEYDSSRIATLYSIAKVKSNFNPNKISKDFNIGIMQLKNSIINSLSQNIGEDKSIDSQFTISENLKYANFYLNSLEKLSNHPIKLFLIYQRDMNSFNEFKNIINFVNYDYKSFLPFEYFDRNEKLKEFIVYYYLYKNSSAKKATEEIKLSSIFENLVKSNQTLDEKVLN